MQADNQRGPWERLTNPIYWKSYEGRLWNPCVEHKLK